MNHNTRSTGRHDLSAGYARMNELAIPADQQPIDMASLPDYVVLVIDGIRLDSKKVLNLMAGEQMQYIFRPSQHNLSLTHVNETSLSGRRTILLSELVVDNKLYADGNCFDARPVENYLMHNCEVLRPEPTPVDLASLPSETVLLVDNAKVKAGKLYKLLIAAENKGQILPVKQSKFDANVIDTAADCDINGRVSIERLQVQNVYWFNGQEFDEIDIERLIGLNLHKLDPRSLSQRFTDSVKANWAGFKADAETFHAKYPGLAMLLITLLTASVAIRILKFTELVDTVGSNILGYMNESALDLNGDIATAIALNNTNLNLALGLIDLVFIAFGGYIGYRITHKSRKPLLNIPLGVLAGILVFRGVQLIVFVAFASTLH